ncbi:MAG: FAD-binding protein [Coriobacteriales bacterium]|nr:FAD-binding protein [Coriobacteriales bacterium]
MSLDRRSFIRLAAGATAGAALTGTLVGCGSETVQTKEHVLGWTDLNFEDECDILVVGAGPSGLFASYGAVEKGKKCICIEKQSGYAGDAMNAANDFMMAYSNVCADVWPEQAQTFEQRKEKLAYYYPDPDVYAIQVHYAEGAVDAFDLMYYKWGCEYNLDMNYGPYKGMFYPKDGIGTGGENWGRVFNNVKAAGVDFRFNTKAVYPIMDEKNELVGMRCYSSDNERWMDIKAKTIILCTGGYASNQEMIAKYYPEWVNIGCATTQAMGDGIVMGQSLGAALSNGFAAKTNLNADTEVIFLAQMFGRSFSILPNGHRFYNENYVHNSASGCMNAGFWEWYAIFDDEIMNGPNHTQVARGGDRIRKGNTIEELAASMDIPVEVLQTGFDEYNAICDAGVDEAFGRTLHLKKLEPPYYAFFNHPLRYKTAGGLAVNTDSQVVDENGNVIPHLFACGCTGGTTDIPPACGSGLYCGRRAAELLDA